MPSSTLLPPLLVERPFANGSALSKDNEKSESDVFRTGVEEDDRVPSPLATVFALLVDKNVPEHQAVRKSVEGDDHGSDHIPAEFALPLENNERYQKFAFERVVESNSASSWTKFARTLDSGDEGL